MSAIQTLISKMGWVLVAILLVGSLPTIWESHAEIETASIIGGYVREGDYVGRTASGEEVRFSIDKDAENHIGAGCETNINMNGKNVRHNLYYSAGTMHFTPNGSFNDLKDLINNNYILKREDRVYSVYASKRDHTPYLTFVRENDKAAYKRMIG